MGKVTSRKHAALSAALIVGDSVIGNVNGWATTACSRDCKAYSSCGKKKRY